MKVYVIAVAPIAKYEKCSAIATTVSNPPVFGLPSANKTDTAIPAANCRKNAMNAMVYHQLCLERLSFMVFSQLNYSTCGQITRAVARQQEGSPCSPFRTRLCRS